MVFACEPVKLWVWANLQLLWTSALVNRARHKILPGLHHKQIMWLCRAPEREHWDPEQGNIRIFFSNIPLAKIKFYLCGKVCFKCLSLFNRKVLGAEPGFMKLPDTIWDRWSSKVGGIVYPDWQLLSKILGKDLSHHLHPHPFNWRSRVLNWGPSAYKADNSDFDNRWKLGNFRKAFEPSCIFLWAGWLKLYTLPPVFLPHPMDLALMDFNFVHAGLTR